MSADFRLALNATVYYADINSDTEVNSAVYRLRASVNVNENPSDMSITLTQTGQINNLFDFEGGSNNRIGISLSDLVTIGNEKVFNTTINLVDDPATEFDEDDYPVELDIEIQFVVLFATNEALQVTSKGLGRILKAPGEFIQVPPRPILVSVYMYCFLQVLVIQSHAKMEQLVKSLTLRSTHAHVYLDILEWIVRK